MALTTSGRILAELKRRSRVLFSVVGTLLIAGSSLSVQGQGQVQFRTFYTVSTPPVDAPVYLNGIDGTLPDSSNTNCRAALIAGPTYGTPASWNTPGNLSIMYNPNNTTVTWANFRSGTNPPFAPGYVSAGPRTVPGIDWGEIALVQMVAWLGNYNSWAEAYAAWQWGTPGVAIGFSNPLTLQFPSGPTDTNITFLVGLQSFSIDNCLGPYFLQFTADPTNQTVNLGESVTFCARAIACPFPSYQWYFNRSPISGAIHSYFQIPSTRVSDMGQYYAVLSGAGWGSRTSAIATLTVTSAVPVIVSQAHSQMAIAGANVDLQASATGFPPLAYQWFFNGVALAGATGSHLNFLHVELARSGSYTLAVSNVYGAVTSAPALLRVIQAPSSSLAGTAVIWGERSLPHVLPGTRFTAVAAGLAHGLALKSDHTVLAWGDNHYGESSVPAGLADVSALASGRYFSQALKSDGTLVSWGNNESGQCNVPAGLQRVIAVSTGYNHTLALQQDGTVVGWGLNDFGQSNVPLGLNGVISVAAGSSHNLALKSDGTVVAWGCNDYGQGTVRPDLRGIIAIAAGYKHNLALKSDGSVVAWGRNNYGQINVPAGLTGVVAVAAGQAHSLALKSDGTVVAWGNYNYNAVPMPQGLNGVIAVAAGDGFSLALKSDGTLVAWGDNSLGQSILPGSLREVTVLSGGGEGQPHDLALQSDRTVLAWGLSSYGASVVPPGLQDVIAVAAGWFHSLALKSDGTVVAWGAGGPGPSVYPHYGQSAVPSDLHEVIAVSAGGLDSVALKADGTLAAWGSISSWGSYVPLGVPDGLSNVVAAAAGWYHCLALKSDGTVTAWGDNSLGQGIVPLGLRDVTAVAAGGWHNLALRSDGAVFAWGHNMQGLLDVPQGLDHVIAVAAGDFHSLALKSDGTVVAWGSNGWNDAINQGTVPLGLSNVFAIAAGGNQSLALVADAPIVKVPPSSQTAETGSTVNVIVHAQGLSPLIYQWFFNGTNLGNPGSSSTLTLNNVRSRDAGDYFVVVSNVYGAVTSAPAVLSLISPVARRMVPALTLKGEPGTSLNLEFIRALDRTLAWTMLDIVDLTNASQWYFDAMEPLAPARFYRARQTEGLNQPPRLSLFLTPAVTLTGAIGSSARVDYINQIGPTDAWVTLATVTLTNTSQEYFDTSAIGQVPRVYRVVTSP